MKARHLPLHLAWLAPLHAAEPAGRWFEHAAERAWIENYDPTLIARRVLTELSFGDRGSGEEIWNHQYAPSFAVELPLTSESFDSKLTAGLTWNF